MVDVTIVNATSPEANWNRQAGGQTDKPVYWEAAIVKANVPGSCHAITMKLIKTVISTSSIFL